MDTATPLVELKHFRFVINGMTFEVINNSVELLNKEDDLIAAINIGNDQTPDVVFTRGVTPYIDKQNGSRILSDISDLTDPLFDIDDSDKYENDSDDYDIEDD